MSVFILFLFLFRVMSVISEGQCDCNTLALITQLIQQEMFERKLEISKLRSELNKISAGPGLIETDTVTDLDISARVEKLEQRFDEYKYESDLEKQAGDEKHGQNMQSANNDEEARNLSFQTLVKQTLRNEKTERMKFISNVQRHIDHFSAILSEFKRSTETFFTEQLSNKPMSTSMETIKDHTEKFKQNTLKTFDTFRVNINEDLKENKQQIEIQLTSIIDNVKDVKDSVSECFAAIDTLKSDTNDIKTNVNSFKEKVSKFQDQVEEHLEGAQKRVSLTVKKDGSCGEIWKKHGNKCYLFRTQRNTWSDAARYCANYGGSLVSIRSQEENNYISTNIKESSWIGLNDRHQENIWRWNSLLLNFADFKNWADGEPNNANRNEDCAVVRTSGEWNDYMCIEQLPFVCQKNPE